ncbi:MAG: bifunctional UDP-3-O-[3-hydroxymyristoyl] N-acetylglucosamine deacetylase/3-hydroxyacyl-ACP dehydratase [Bacteroidia bacterium]|nr:bifunctional UDP-3-O-[3-hydroxymyristoyl] N-acetylglucosamine deacetylase/3-hydroxyacyl-ACP dehydratase [Bacteroidia bacterium]
MTEKQTTISAPATVSGVGLHTGKVTTLTYKPASANVGYVFKRIDLEGQPEIAVDADLVVDTSRGTTIGKGGATVQTIEHSMAALFGLGIDNVIIEIDGSEPPILDGSSAQFMEALQKVDVVELEADRNYFELKETLIYRDEASGVEMIAVPADKFQVSVMVDYNSPVLGRQHASLYDISEFKKDIASSRTFCFLHELEMLLEAGLIKGGDLNNAIVVVDKEVDDAELKALAHLFNRPDIKVAKEGILNNVELRSYNEPARHKLLDVVGDLTLVGQPIKAHIFATRPGHKANAAFAQKIKQHIKAEKLKKANYPVYDPGVKPLYDINQIVQILPHRPPFLLIDKILEMSESHVVGVKNVTMNEPFFAGHFPGDPVMPGVLQVEAMAQAGGILVLSTVPDPENYVTYFLKLIEVKFRHKVLPGDSVVFRLDLVSPIRRGICHMKGYAMVGSTVVMEAEMMAQIVKRP